MTSETLELSMRETFDDEAEAVKAFYARTLRWQAGDKAYTYKMRGVNQVIGHTSLTVLDVASISSDGSPVYKCRLHGGSLVDIEAEMILTKEQLLFKPDGTPTAYHDWLKTQIAERDTRRQRAANAPTAVTVRMIF